MRSKITASLVCVGLTIALSSPSLSAETNTNLVLTYTPPTTRLDGTPLPAGEIAGYELIGGGLFAEISKDVSEYEALDYTLPREGACFSLITKDTSGNRSEPTETRRLNRPWLPRRSPAPVPEANTRARCATAIYPWGRHCRNAGMAPWQ